jgi:CheY-like chemotaxis protein
MNAATFGRPEQAPRRRVLVIEDNIDGARLMATLIRTMGHEVDYAINGYAALRLVETFRPDVILVDLALPDMTGWAVARELRQRPGGDKLRIYATTGRYGEEARQRSLAVGCDEHLLKPLDPALLEKLLGQL